MQDDFETCIFIATYTIPADEPVNIIFYIYKSSKIKGPIFKRKSEKLYIIVRSWLYLLTV